MKHGWHLCLEAGGRARKIPSVQLADGPRGLRGRGIIGREMSLEGSQSPAPSSSSDDFAALLDAELLGDRHSSPDVLEGDALGSPEVDNGGKSSESEEDSSEEVSEEEEEESDVDILEDQEEELVNVESDQDILEELRYSVMRCFRLFICMIS